MPDRQKQTRNINPDKGKNHSGENLRKELLSVHDNPRYEIVAYPDLLLTFAQIRFEKIMEVLNHIRKNSPRDSISVNIQEIEENLKIMYKMYERTIPYLTMYYQGNKQDF